MSDFPFFQADSGINENVFYRVFDKNTNAKDLVWHRDKNNRRVTILTNEGGWKIQMDDCVPVELYVGQDYLIEKEFYHRLIKGQGVLIARIEE